MLVDDNLFRKAMTDWFILIEIEADESEQLREIQIKDEREMKMKGEYLGQYRYERVGPYSLLFTYLMHCN